MKKLLAGLFVFGAFVFAVQAHAFTLSDALLQIQSLRDEILQLKSSLRANALNTTDPNACKIVSFSVTPLTINLGDSVIISWETKNCATTSVSASDVVYGFGRVDATGAKMAWPQKDVSYYLTVTELAAPADISTTTSPINIKVNSSTPPSATSYSVYTSVGSNGSIYPTSASVVSGTKGTFTLSPNSGYTPVVYGCGGTLSGNTYTTASITSNCTVSATFKANSVTPPTSYSVYTSAGANGSISPTSASVVSGSKKTFTLYPNSGYTPVLTGCGGTLSGNTYTTANITSNCTVYATFKANEVVPTPITLTDVSLSGNTQVGQTLKAVLTPSNAKATYRWIKKGTDGIARTLKEYDTTGSYTITSSDLGSTILVIAKGTSGTIGGENSDIRAWSGVVTQVIPIPATPSITVTSPNGGETYTAGQQITVKWKSENIPSDSIIDVYLESSSYSKNISSGDFIANSSIFPVVLPETLNNSDYKLFGNFKIKLIVRNRLSSSIIFAQDYSDNYFTINSSTSTTPSITVLSPVEGDRFKVGDQITVKWNSSSVLQATQILLSLENMNSGTIIYLTEDKNIPVIYTTNDGIETFRIPTSDYANVKTGDYRITLTSKASDGITSVTNKSGLFTIVASDSTPSLSVLYPQGNEIFKAGQQITVKWKSENIPSTENVLIEITKAYKINDPYGGWTTLAESTSNDGVQLVTLPSNLTSGTYELAIKRYFGAGDDISDDLFTINSSTDTGCSSGQVYSSTTGQACKEAVIKDDGCKGSIYSSTTGKECPASTLTTEAGCLNGQVYSSTTGKLCPVTIDDTIIPGEPKIDKGCFDNAVFSSLTGNRCVYNTTVTTTNTTTTTTNTRTTTNTTDTTNTRIDRTLRRGTRGEDVAKLQSFLGITADGVFGRGTESSVIKWQVSQGLTGDGLFGKNSRMTAGLQ